MRYHFDIEEVLERNRICSMCEHSNQSYCNLYKTDSIVFLVSKCKQLEKLKSK